MMAYMNACGVAMSYQIDFGIDYIIPSVVNNNFIHCSSRDNKMNIVYPTGSQARVQIHTERSSPRHLNNIGIIKLRCKQLRASSNKEYKKRIRYKSLSDNLIKNDESKKKINTSREQKNEINKLQKCFYEPKIIDLQFQKFVPGKPKRSKQSISTHEYCLLMIQSMHEYYQKIEKGKRKKIQRCQKLKSFGLHIQSISVNNDNGKAIAALERRKSFNRRKNMINKQFSLIKTSVNSENIMAEGQSQQLRESISISSSKPSFFSKKKLMFKIEKKDNYQKYMDKLNRMFNHFSIILYSFGVYLNKNDEICNVNNVIKKNDKKYLYFVGKGNNKNLIVSIFKKRWWWSQTENILQANFVWSQLKVDAIIQKQNEKLIPDHQHYLWTNFNTIKTETQHQESSNPIYTIFHVNHDRRFHNKLPQKQQKKYLQKLKIPQTVHNHYSSNYMLGNKKALYYNIAQYREYKKQKIFSYIPLTFHIEKINSAEWKQFEIKSKKELKKVLWIVKPGQNSNRGQGIFISNSIQNIKNNIEKLKNHTFIIQKYIKNNFMFQKRKFDIRTYLLMVTLGGVKKFYWYSEGYLRTSSQIYNLTKLNDPFIHLTNDAIQSTGSKYGKYEKGNKITYSQFQRYLDINFPNQKYQVCRLVEEMKNISRQVVEATYFKVDPCQKQCNFQLFGMDFLIDSSFKPWLLEVNTNPCLELSSPVLERLIPRMIQNLVRIVIDPIFQPPEKFIPKNSICYISENIIQKNRFQLIFDTLFDRNLEWEKFSLNINNDRIYEDSNEEFQNDGEIIKFQD